MEFLPTNHLGAVGQNNDHRTTPETNKKGRFGLPKDSSFAEKINDAAGNTPATNLKENGKPILFEGEKLPKDEKTLQIFIKSNGQSEKSKNKHSNNLGPNNKKSDGVTNNPAVADEDLQARKVKLEEIKAKINSNSTHFVHVDDEKQTIKLTKLSKKTDLTQVKNGFILAGNDVVPLGIIKQPKDLKNYNFTTDDKNINKDFELIKNNFINANVFIATDDEIKILNTTNQNRKEVEDKKIDTTILDNKEKIKTNQKQIEPEKQKINEFNIEKKISKKETKKTTFSSDQEKDEKAIKLKHNEKYREEKQISESEANKKNQKANDETILNRIKQKN